MFEEEKFDGCSILQKKKKNKEEERLVDVIAFFTGGKELLAGYRMCED